MVNLVYLRASQINGCAYCIDMHSRDLVVRIKRLRPSTFGQAIEMTHAVKDSSV